MFVMKRDGSQEPVYYDKIIGKIRKLTWSLSNDIDTNLIAKKVLFLIFSLLETHLYHFQIDD